MKWKGKRYDWVLSQAKDIGKKTPLQIAKWFEYHCTIFECERISNGGEHEEVYVVCAGPCNIKDNNVTYITDTGQGYGGTGSMIIKDYYASSSEIVKTKNQKRAVWVFKRRR